MRDEDIFGTTTGAAILMVGAVSILVGGATALPVGIGMFFFLALTFLGQGLLTVPATPPSVGLVTFLGRRTELVIEEGLRFLPFREILFGVIIVKVQKMDFDFTPQGIRTPDLAVLGVKVSATVTPDLKNLVAYLNSGGERGVRGILDNIVQDRLRGWALSPSEGPADFREALGAQSEVISVLLEAITSLPPLHPTIHTSTLLNFFSNPPLPPSVHAIVVWGKDWGGLREKLSHLSPDKHSALERSVAERRELIRAARSGACCSVIPSLGVVINRLTLGEMTASGAVVNAAEGVAREQQERVAESIELAHVIDKIKELSRTLKLSPEAVIRLIQTERGKAKIEITEHLLSASPETLNLLRYLGEVLVNKNGGGEKK